MNRDRVDAMWLRERSLGITEVSPFLKGEPDGSLVGLTAFCRWGKRTAGHKVHYCKAERCTSWVIQSI